MNRQHWKEMLPVIEAFANGATVEKFRSTYNRWECLLSPTFDGPSSLYRIAPKPRTVFVNEYPNGEFSTWPDRDTADLNATGERIACHEVPIPPVTRA